MSITPPAITRILVPTDYTPCADQALSWAVLQSRAFGAELTVLHVLEKAVHFGTFGYTEGPQAAQIEQDHDRLEAHIRSRLADTGLSANLLIEVGDPTIKIREVARRERIDLIVMGTHGKSGLEDLLFSSVTEKVMHHSGCPVLAVPPSTDAPSADAQ